MLKTLFTALVFALLASGSNMTHAQSNAYLDSLPHWQTTLDKFVDEEGRTDFQSPANDHAELTKFVDSISEVSPTSHPELFPNRADRTWRKT